MHISDTPAASAERWLQSHEKKNFYIEGIPTPCLPTMAFREIYSVLYRLESIHFDYQSVQYAFSCMELPERLFLIT